MSNQEAVAKPVPDKLGFLDLPAEIRLEIYHHLLIGSRKVWWSCKPPPDVSAFPSERHPELNIRYIGGRPRPANIYHEPDSDETLFFHELLSSEILSTCRTVSDEATSILYRENVFVFTTDAYNIDNSVGPIKMKKAVKNLMSYDEDDWDDYEIPTAIQDSTLAAFIRKIGSDKSSLIRSLELDCHDTDYATTNILRATQLVAYHLSGLEILTLDIYKKTIAWDESPDYWHPDWSSPFWTNGDFRPMLKALEGLVDRVHWLQKFKYDGQTNFDVEDGIWQIRELERRVDRRTQRRKEKKERLLDEQKNVK